MVATRFTSDIVYRMNKVERRMVKTNAMNTQGDKIMYVTELQSA